jgi:hypothetical protein
MKFRLTLLSILILSLALSACGGGGDGGDPTEPVKDFFDGFADLDAEKASGAICEKYREDMKDGLTMVFGFLALGGDDASIEVVDLKLKVEDKSDDEATVVATSGMIKMTLAGEVDETDLTENSEPLKVVKEDGKWYICDDSFSEGFAP